MMFRYRRYRVFVIFAVLTILAFYHLSGSGKWAVPPAGTISEKPKAAGKVAPKLKISSAPNPVWEVARETKKLDVEVPAAHNTNPPTTPPPLPAAAVPPVQDRPPAPLRPPKQPPKQKPAPEDAPTVTSPIGHGHWQPPALEAPGNTILDEHGLGRLEVEPLPENLKQIHWIKPVEHFPVPSESMIPLPTGSARSIPKIQHEFKRETKEERAVREDRLHAIKSSFLHAWHGYKEHAWMQDELTPVTGRAKNPFAGWGATLVDALDTLWIMGLTEEFDEAANAVKDIDFTTTARSDIPLFETTIRYLGGLLGAYDISEGRHQILLDKAVELAEILMGALDTPNRMPVTYYYWKPSFASQPHRASTRVVLAELGSLSMEFTRLAQITKDQKYYDAVARITDALEEWQNNTRLPGMWPVYVDASGCKKPDSTPPAQPLHPADQRFSHSAADRSTSDAAPYAKGLGEEDLPVPIEKEVEETDELEEPVPVRFVPGSPSKGRIEGWGNPADATGENSKGDGSALSTKKLTISEDEESDLEGMKVKRQLDQPIAGLGDAQGTNDPAPVGAPIPPPAAPPAQKPTKPDEGPICLPQGLTAPDSSKQQYTLGGMSDSTYEYLPKQYLLLGGQLDQYRSMYESAMDTASKYLLFRPMTPENYDILLSGSYTIPSKKSAAQAKNSKSAQKDEVSTLEPEGAHLTCFAGGMYAMGAKLFDRPEDLDIAIKLTEGCVWAYNATQTGIMPEAFLAVPCDSRDHCEWNQTKYWEVLDPMAASREANYQAQLKRYKKDLEQAQKAEQTKAAAAALAAAAAEQLAMSTAALPTPAPGPGEPAAGAVEKEVKVRRQLDLDVENVELGPPVLADEATRTVAGGSDPNHHYRGSPFGVGRLHGPATSPLPPLTHEQYVMQRIERERLPAGFTKFKSTKYILRPEAIESVFYLYRITGAPAYREMGWRMFAAVEKHTRAPYGHSAIADVTQTAAGSTQLDSMESFWLAETLKYFYLLFADEDLVSLDDWVLNTEAHPFRRWDAPPLVRSAVTGADASGREEERRTPGRGV